MAVQELPELQGRGRVEVVFFSESHLDGNKADELRRRLGFDFAHVVSSD